MCTGWASRRGTFTNGALMCQPAAFAWAHGRAGLWSGSWRQLCPSSLAAAAPPPSSTAATPVSVTYVHVHARPWLWRSQLEIFVLCFCYNLFWMSEWFKTVWHFFLFIPWSELYRFLWGIVEKNSLCDCCSKNAKTIIQGRNEKINTYKKKICWKI